MRSGVYGRFQMITPSILILKFHVNKHWVGIRCILRATQPSPTPKSFPAIDLYCIHLKDGLRIRRRRDSTLHVKRRRGHKKGPTVELLAYLS